MKVSVATPRSRRAPKDTLEDFACLMGATVPSTDGSSNDASSGDTPKNRLDLLLSTGDEWVATVPSLSLSTPKGSAASNPHVAAQLAENCLSRPIQYDRTHVSNAAKDMAWSVAGSFKSLVYANLRSFARMRDIENSWDTSAAKSFRSSMSDESLVRPWRVSSTFSTSSDTNPCQLQLQANFSLDVDIDGLNESISIDATGIISGSFSTGSNAVNSIKVELDSSALLLSLRQHARLAAYKFVTRNVPASVVRKNGNGSEPTLQLASTKKRAVTPCSSPLLSILSEAAAKATLIEPMTLDRSHPKGQCDTAECRTLPPKKRLRRSVTPTLH